MMKKALTLLILVCSILSFTACSNSSTQVGGGGNSVTDDTANNVQEDSNNESAPTKVSENSTLTMSNGDMEIEFTLTDVCFMDAVHSKSDIAFYYFPAQDDKCYVVAKITIKNVGSDSVDSSFFDDIEVTFDDCSVLTYEMQQLNLESTIMSEYWSCEPLKAVDIYWVQLVSDGYESNGADISISFKVGETTYTY